MDDLAIKFDELEPLYRRLIDEVEFAISEALAEKGLKVHSLTSRLKSKESFLGKLERKAYADPFAEIEDIAGLRIVCLFLSEINEVVETLASLFEVRVEDKLAGANDDQFGYMSIHCIGTLRSEHAGPRYDRIRRLKFEIQVRTLLMDAWANVSHHLAYKGEASIPSRLRRDFHALSGLFYVADQHFELFFRQSLEVEREETAEVRQGSRDSIEINLNTVEELLLEMFPARKHSSRHDISVFVEEVNEAGYQTITPLEDAIRSGIDRAETDDLDRPDDNKFTSLGMGRVALGHADQNYEQINTLRARRNAARGRGK